MKKPNETKEIQNKLLEIIEFIDNICKKNNIEYFLAYGTCIGAIRHKGFIPWDDDLDIVMTYRNYMKFREIMNKQTSKYIFQTPIDDNEYNMPFGKVRDCTTTYIQKGNEYSNMNQGLYVDIFPLVGYPTRKISRIMFKINRSLAMYPFVNMINNPLLKQVANIIYRILGKRRMFKIFNKKITKYSCEEAKELISVYAETIEKEINEKEIYGTPKMVKFESLNLPIPEKYDIYLTKIYGNYMEIPSKEEIEKCEHEIVFMDLNKSYKEYLNERPWVKK